MKKGSLDRLIRIERKVNSASFSGAGQAKWELVAEVWASVQDALPSRAERLAEGMTMTAHPARVRMLYLDGITTAMRFVEGDRIMQIVSGPAVLGRREGMEFMVEDYSPAGNPA